MAFMFISLEWERMRAANLKRFTFYLWFLELWIQKGWKLKSKWMCCWVFGQTDFSHYNLSRTRFLVKDWLHDTTRVNRRNRKSKSKSWKSQMNRTEKECVYGSSVLMQMRLVEIVGIRRVVGRRGPEKEFFRWVNDRENGGRKREGAALPKATIAESC